MVRPSPLANPNQPALVQQQTRIGSSLAGSANVLSEYRPGIKLNPDYEPYQLNLLLFNDVVQYKCSCGKFRRLNNTYFCRHCMAMRCRSCVTHEVDSQYCQHCLEYIPTIDPKFQLNKCASCYQCPSCQHLLSTSVLSITPAISDNSQSVVQPDEVIRRTSQLVCEFCRWSSETFVTEGSRIVNNLADIEVPNAARIDELISFYRAISQKEKTEKKKRRFHARSGNTMDLLKKYGIDNTLSPKLFESLRARTSYTERSPLSTVYNMEPTSNEEGIIESFKPTESMKPEGSTNLDTSYYYNEHFDLEKVSGIEQRLAQVEIQPDKVKNFKPISKSLSVKRSLRCKECERNLCRSEYSPVSIRFKIQSAAYYHVPELRLRSDTYPIKLKLNEINIVEFSIQNQTLSQIKVRFAEVEEAEKDNDCNLVLPPHEMELGPKDDTADYEHVPLQLRPLNEDTQIIFQSPFKIGFFIKVTPKEKDELLSIAFLLSHDVLLMPNPKENERVRVTHYVRVNLGSVE